MKKRIRTVAALAFSALAVTAMSATAAFAQYPPGQDFGVSCGDQTTPGGTVTCGVVGAAAGEELAATAEATEVFYTETFTANADGEASFAFTVPAEAEGSTVTVRVVGAVSGATADQLEVAADTDGDDGAGTGVTPGTGAGTLPLTGSQVTVLTTVGLALLALGLLALRRREDAKVSA